MVRPDLYETSAQADAALRLLGELAPHSHAFEGERLFVLSPPTR